MPGASRDRVTAIIVGAGRGVRFGVADKVMAPLNGRPVLAHAISAAQDATLVDDIVVVVGEHLFAAVEELADSERWSKVKEIVVGGERRQDSVEAGLAKVLLETTYVAVHDAARPLANCRLFDACIESARIHGAAISAVPVSDTLKRVHSDAIVETVPREGLWAAQTPQVFRRDLLEKAFDFARSGQIEVTDEASLLEQLGIPVAVVQGSTANMKITVPQDLAVAAALLAARVE